MRRTTVQEEEKEDADQQNMKATRIIFMIMRIPIIIKRTTRREREREE